MSGFDATRNIVFVCKNCDDKSSYRNTCIVGNIHV